MRPMLLAGFLGIVGLVLDAGQACAIPVIYGSGDTVTFVTHLPEDSPARRKGQNVIGGNPDKVGFKHYQFHIFWLPLWTSTSEGQFVAYRESGLIGTWHEPLGTNPQEVAAKTGVPKSQLTIPWSARNPWGLYLLIGGLVLGAVAKAVAAKWPRQQSSGVPVGHVNWDVLAGRLAFGVGLILLLAVVGGVVWLIAAGPGQVAPAQKKGYRAWATDPKVEAELTDAMQAVIQSRFWRERPDEAAVEKMVEYLCSQPDGSIILIGADKGMGMIGPREAENYRKSNPRRLVFRGGFDGCNVKVDLLDYPGRDKADMLRKMPGILEKFVNDLGSNYPHISRKD